MVLLVARDEFLREYEAQSTTRRRIRVFKRCARGEPYALKDELVRDLLIRAHEKGNRHEVKGIMGAVRPIQPRAGQHGDPQQIQTYHRWVIATINERLMSRKTEVSAELNRLLRSEEGDAKRAAAGLRDHGPHRLRKIDYEKIDRYCWRLIVMAGLDLIGPQEHEAT
jgi:hypothetical protein